MKYKLNMTLERDGAVLTISDEVNYPFDLDDYIYDHDLETYHITEFKLGIIDEEN